MNSGDSSDKKSDGSSGGHPPELPSDPQSGSPKSEHHALLKSRHSLLKSKLYAGNETRLSQLTGATRFTAFGAGSRQEMPKLEPGAVINGRYRVEALLGEGGMGVVYKVADTLVPGRFAALKTIRGAGARVEMRALFKAEFQNMTQLKHPGIAAVYDFEAVFGTADYMFTMEYIEGVDLYRATSEKPWKDITEFLVQISRALSYVHNRGLIHFDLKPGNVIVNLEGQAKILDFGLAGKKVQDDSGTIRGTMAYCAPELASARAEVDFRADLYSMGIMAYEILARRLPFRAETTHDWIHKHHFEAISFDEKVNEKVPPWLREIIVKLCAKQPSERFRSANAVIDAINKGSGIAYEVETDATRACYILSSRFVGRDAELEAIDKFLTGRISPDPTSGALVPPLILIGGRGGVGKSRLMREVRQKAQLAQLTFVEANCYENGLSEFGPIAELLAHVVSLARAAGAEALIQKFGSDLLKAAPDLDIKVESDGKHESTSGGGRQRIIQQVAEFLVQLCRVVPYAIYMNDLQWAQSGTIELVSYLARRVANSEEGVAPPPIAILGSFRDDEIEGKPFEEMIGKLAGEKAVETVLLAPLGPDQTKALIASMLGVDDLPGEFSDRIAAETQGNPFFIEEVMRTLVENGSVYLEDGKWATAKEIGKLEIPNSIASAFMRRCANLGKLEREVLDCLAACDRPVWPSTLARIVQSTLDEVQAALVSLARREMVIRSRGDDIRYRIIHDRMRAVIHDALDADRRKVMHSRIAKVLEARFRREDSKGSHLLDENADWLAFHFSAAEDWRKAVVYGITAAKGAKKIGRVNESLKMLDQTHEWLKKHPDPEKGKLILVDLLLEKDRIYEIQAARAQQQVTLIELLSLLDGEKNADRLAEVLIRLGDLFTLMGQHDDAADYLSKALAFSRDRADIISERQVLRSLAFLFWQKRDRVNMEACYDDIFEIDLKQKDFKAYAFDAANLANAFQNLKEYDRALEVLQKTIDASKKAGDIHREQIAYYHIANTYMMQGNLEKAVEVALKEYEICLVAEVPYATNMTLEHLGDFYWQLGKHDEAMKWTLKSVEFARDFNFIVLLCGYLKKTADRYIHLGRLEEAVPYLVESAKKYVILEDSENERKICAQLAMVWERIPGKAKQAYAAWTKLQDACERANDPVNGALALENMGKFARQAGEPSETAIAHYNGALAVYQAIGDAAKIGAIHNAMGSLNWKEGRFEGALVDYRIALESFKALGDEARTGVVMNAIGATLKSLKRYEEARAALREAAEHNAASKQILLEGHARAALADLSVEAAQEEALALYKRSLDLRVQVNDRNGEGWMLHNVARIELERRRTKEAQDLLTKALAIARETSNAKLIESCNTLVSSMKGEEFKRHLDALLEVSLATAYEPDKQERVALDQIVKLLNGDRALLFLLPEEHEDLGLKSKNPKVELLEEGAPVPASASAELPVSDSHSSMSLMGGLSGTRATVANAAARRRHLLQLRIGRNSEGQDLTDQGNYSKTVVRDVFDNHKPRVLTSSADGAELGAQSMVVHGLRSIVAAPLLIVKRGEEARCIGVLYVDSRASNGLFNEQDLDILVAISNHVAIAFEMATFNRRLERLVRIRTAELNDANRNITAMVNSLGQGFLIFKPDGSVLPTYSKACETLLEVMPAGLGISSVLKIEKEKLPDFESVISALFSEIIAFEDLVSFAPNLFPHAHGKRVMLEYKPVRDESNRVENIVLIATDRTGEWKAQQEAEKEREFASMIVKLMKDKNQFIDFIKTVKVLIAQLEKESHKGADQAVDLPKVLRDLHTIKGGAAMFSLRKIKEAAHSFESKFAELAKNPAKDALGADLASLLKECAAGLNQVLAEVIDENYNVFGKLIDAKEQFVEISKNDINDFYEALAAGKDIASLRERFISQFVAERIYKCFGQYEDIVSTTAKDLGKEVSPISFDGGELRIHPAPYSELFASFVHAFRNAVDHGLERPEERENIGKPRAGAIHVRFARKAIDGKNWLRIEVQDDGKGIDPERIRSKLRKEGRADLAESLSDHEVVQVVFGAGFSTRTDVTEHSGRGVGMDAIRFSAERLGGNAEVSSKLGSGTTLVVQVPEIAPERAPAHLAHP